MSPKTHRDGKVSSRNRCEDLLRSHRTPSSRGIFTLRVSITAAAMKLHANPAPESQLSDVVKQERFKNNKLSSDIYRASFISQV
jgi:hypothetical protein